MPRHKNQRTTTFKPRCLDFIPKNLNSEQTVLLLEEEVEAIYLMDLLGFYQENAAIKMNVSRSTFARMIKNARQKIALALLNGLNLKLAVDTSKVTVAFCCQSQDLFENLLPTNKFLIILKLQSNQTIEKLVQENPANNTINKPSVVLPMILQEHGVNYFITSKIGEGLKNSLLTKGINVMIQNDFDINDI